MREHDIGDNLVEEIIEHYWEDNDFLDWLEFDFSRKLAGLIKPKTEASIPQETVSYTNKIGE